MRGRRKSRHSSRRVSTSAEGTPRSKGGHFLSLNNLPLDQEEKIDNQSQRLECSGQIEELVTSNMVEINQGLSDSQAQPLHSRRFDVNRLL